MTSGGFSNQAKILRGAFVEHGLSVPPLFVVFQFNPLTISRSRSATIKKQDTNKDSKPVQSSGFIQQLKDKSGLAFDRGGQVTVNPETLTFDIRLDATDRLDQGDAVAEQFGIAPQLSTLELMMLPKNQSLLGGALSLLSGEPKNFAFFDPSAEPPVILFVWGRKKVLPVTITGMQIKEEEFSVDLNPIRATISVSLEVIESANAPFLYTKGMKEAVSLLNLANIYEITNTVVPR